MLRNPTCDNGVIYDMIPCGGSTEGGDRDGEEEGEMSPCAGMKGKKKKKCEAAQQESGEEEGSGNPCDALKGKKKKKCMQAQEGADSGVEDPCAGLKGKKKKKCMAAEAEMA